MEDVDIQLAYRKLSTISVLKNLDGLEQPLQLLDCDASLMFGDIEKTSIANVKEGSRYPKSGGQLRVFMNPKYYVRSGGQKRRMEDEAWGYCEVRVRARQGSLSHASRMPLRMVEELVAGGGDWGTN